MRAMDGRLAKNGPTVTIWETISPLLATVTRTGTHRRNRNVPNEGEDGALRRKRQSCGTSFRTPCQEEAKARGGAGTVGIDGTVDSRATVGTFLEQVDGGRHPDQGKEENRPGALPWYTSGAVCCSRKGGGDTFEKLGRKLRECQSALRTKRNLGNGSLKVCAEHKESTTPTLRGPIVFKKRSEGLHRRVKIRAGYANCFRKSGGT